MNAAPKVSVIIPVYNAERYLRECLDSVVNQTLRDIEIICVDDGSTDGSLGILREYEAKDERISIVRQENLHAGTARNNGMRQARGKYIIFLDSDDYFDRTLLERAYRCAEKNRAEIVFFNHYICDQQTGAITRYPFMMRRGVFSGESLGDRVFSSFHCVPWNRFYLRAFVEEHHLEYQTIYKMNDVYFTHLSVALAERIACIRKPLVYYRANNPESLQGQNLPAHPYLIEAYSALKQSLKAIGRFRGNILDGYNKCLSATVDWWAMRKPEETLSKDYYTAMKQNLVPMLFDSSADFSSNTILPDVIYRSVDYQIYLPLLFETIVKRQSRVVSKKSKDYIVGHALLAIPRYIRRII